MARLISKRPEVAQPSLAKYHARRNSVLIQRNQGGLGDILMHRMLFEDFKKKFPDCRLSFACPHIYQDAAHDHPYLDEVLDCTTVVPNDFGIIYNTSTACSRYEILKSPYADKNRADIWAGHCGIDLTSHEMHIKIDPQLANETNEKIESFRDKKGPKVLLSAISAMQGKNLLKHQSQAIVKRLREHNCYVYTTHSREVPDLMEVDVPLFQGRISTWMSYVNAADYVVSVDTAAFHCAGGMKKPTMGIFTYCDGFVYSRYYPKVELVQLHRDLHPHWTCGPCYNFPDCPKTNLTCKPCLTEITTEMLIAGIDKMLEKWPLLH